MTTVEVSVANNEFDAAQALLDLQSNVRDNNPEQRDAASLTDGKEDMEKSATFFLSCFLKPIPTNTAVQSIERHGYYALENSDPTDLSVKKKLKRKCNTDHDYILYDSRTEPQHKVDSERYIKHSPENCFAQSSSVVDTLDIYRKYETHKSDKAQQESNSRDIGTQTEEKYQLAIVKTMERTIEKLYEKIQSLEEQIQANAELLKSTEFDVSDDDLDLADVDDASYESKADRTVNISFASDSDEDAEVTQYGRHTYGNDPDYKVGNDSKSKKVLRISNINVNANDMIPIGDGNAMIPSRIYRHINWKSYTSATRKLLTAVFSRKVLATHSLTGKPSPAFPNKPAKKKLDTSLVNDIVQAVVEKCNVPENVVRTSITTKCADESKMFRTRQQNKKKRKYKVNRENIPPESDSDDI